MGLEQKIEEIKIIETIDNEINPQSGGDRDGVYQLGKHRDGYFQLNLCPTEEQAPNDCKIEYIIFPGHKIYSKVMNKHASCELVIFMHDDVPEPFRKPIIAHEIGELIYGREGHSKTESHNYGIQCERAYANEFLDEKTRKAFFEWTEDLRANSK